MTTEPRTKAQAMTTPGLAAKARIRGAWFAAFDRPLPELRAEVGQLFAAIETEAARLTLEDMTAEIGSMMSIESWSKVETQARHSAFSDVLAVISDRLSLLSTEESRTDDDERHERLVASGRMTCEDMRHDHD